jgi:hypothetical protein
MDPEDVLYVDVSCLRATCDDIHADPAGSHRAAARQFDGDCLEYLLHFFERSKCVSFEHLRALDDR